MSNAVVYIYLQHDLPRCFWHSLRKTRELWDGDIYLVAPNRESNYAELKEHNVKFVYEDTPSDGLRDGLMEGECKDYIELYEQNTLFRNMYPLWDNFWDNACKRFVYLYLIQSRYNIDRIIHLETDVIPYIGIEEMFIRFDDAYNKKLVFSPHAPSQLSCCFMYCDCVNIMKTFCDKNIEYFKRGAEYFAQEILNETHFAHTFYKEHGELVDFFPTMPGEAHHDELGFLIDSTSWGMWVNGLQRNAGEKFANNAHHIGQKLLEGKYDVHFEFENERVKLPWIYDKTTRMSYPLATLHFNSKRTEKWI